jgi:hypothetical protein
VDVEAVLLVRLPLPPLPPLLPPLLASQEVVSTEIGAIAR